MTKLKRRYLAYLESAHWRDLREQAFKRDGYRCTSCGSTKGLQGHHKTYRKDLRTCTAKDIVTLCVFCHKRHHRNKAKARRNLRKFEKSVDRLVWLICKYGETTHPQSFHFG